MPTDRIESVRAAIATLRARASDSPLIAIAMAYATDALAASERDGEHDIEGAHNAWIALCRASSGLPLGDAAMDALDAATCLAEAARHIERATGALSERRGLRLVAAAP